MFLEKAFAVLSVLTVADLLQLPLVRGNLIFSQCSDKDSMKHLLGLQLQHLFQYEELTEVVRQNDQLFIDLLIKVRVGNIDDEVEKLLKARFIDESDENYPVDVLHMYTENKPAVKRNEAVLNNLPSELYTIEADDKIPDNCKYPLALIEAAQNQKPTNIGGLAKVFKLKIGAKVMLTVNIDIQVGLINGQTGNIRYIEFAEGTAHKVYVMFSDEQAGLKVMRSSYVGRQNSWVSIEKCETEISVKKGSALPTIKRTQFPLTLPWASIVHKVQGLSLEQGVVDFDFHKQKSFGPGQIE